MKLGCGNVLGCGTKIFFKSDDGKFLSAKISSITITNEVTYFVKVGMHTYLVNRELALSEKEFLLLRIKKFCDV